MIILCWVFNICCRGRCWYFRVEEIVIILPIEFVSEWIGSRGRKTSWGKRVGLRLNIYKSEWKWLRILLDRITFCWTVIFTGSFVFQINIGFVQIIGSLFSEMDAFLTELEWEQPIWIFEISDIVKIEQMKLLNISLVLGDQRESVIQDVWVEWNVCFVLLFSTLFTNERRTYFSNSQKIYWTKVNDASDNASCVAEERIWVPLLRVFTKFIDSNEKEFSSNEVFSIFKGCTMMMETFIRMNKSFEIKDYLFQFFW